MYIVVGNESVKQLEQKYLVLELDTIRYQDKTEPVTSYCVIDNEHVPLIDIQNMQQYIDLHGKLIENYKKQNWEFCINALEHLKGTFRGELDTFYDSLEQRLETLQENPPSKEWDGTLIIKS